MAVHDWTRVEDSVFHHFHTVWIGDLSKALNGGMLPPGYYAMGEQHVGRKIADVLNLQTSNPKRLRAPTFLTPPAKKRRRTLTIRHATGHRIVALVEILSPSNKAAASEVGDFVRKVQEALGAGIHVVVVDLFPPGRHDRQGMHGAVLRALTGERYDLPADRQLTLASYAAATNPIAYLEHLAVGDPFPELPLFLTPDWYVRLPLETTYTSAYGGVPEVWRGVLEGRSPTS
jgi:hypothetical protein